MAQGTEPKVMAATEEAALLEVQPTESLSAETVEALAQGLRMRRQPASQ